MRYQLFLGNRVYSSWSLRGWLMFRAFGIDCAFTVVPLRTADFAQFTRDHEPSLTVPTLEIVDDDGRRQIVWDSLAIAEYLHERHPGAGIWPAEARARAAARSLCAEMHSGFFALRSELPMNLRREYRHFEPSDEARRDIARIEYLWHWSRSTHGAAGPYLFGAAFSAADAFFTPVASRFRTYGIELGPASRAYAEALLAHPAMVEFHADAMQEPWVIDEVEFGPE